MRRLALAGALLLSACGSPRVDRSAAVGPVDRIVVEKAAHRMRLVKGGTIVRTYRVALGSGGSGAKQREGDRLTPEGDYVISGRNPRSAFHLSLRISYPTEGQRRAAKDAGVPPGGDIMIHGLPNGQGSRGFLYKGRDWTDGCIAVTDAEIEEIWRLVPDGAKISILP